MPKLTSSATVKECDANNKARKSNTNKNQPKTGYKSANEPGPYR